MQIVTREILNKKIKIVPGKLSTPCWEFTGAKDPAGYGAIRHCGKKCNVHKVSYEIFKGPIPYKHDVHHLCEYKPCCNPDHLDVLTRKQHSHQSINHLAMAAALGKLKTRCAKGHTFTAENTKIKKRASGIIFRVCRACANEWTRINRANKKLLIVNN